MQISQAAVVHQYEWVLDRSDRTVDLINQVRDDLGKVFDTNVAVVTPAEYREEVESVFADGDLAVNVATIIALLRDLDVEDDYPGFIIDEILGRELASMIAGGQPWRLLGEATFHYADVHISEGSAGIDDLDAGLAAGFQTRLPGWEWTTGESPFSVS